MSQWCRGRAACTDRPRCTSRRPDRRHRCRHNRCPHTRVRHSSACRRPGRRGHRGRRRCPHRHPGHRRTRRSTRRAPPPTTSQNPASQRTIQEFPANDTNPADVRWSRPSTEARPWTTPTASSPEPGPPTGSVTRGALQVQAPCHACATVLVIQLEEANPVHSMSRPIVDVELSTAGLPSLARVTIGLYRRSYSTTASGSYSWQTALGTGATPAGFLSNVAPTGVPRGRDLPAPRRRRRRPPSGARRSAVLDTARTEAASLARKGHGTTPSAVSELRIPQRRNASTSEFTKAGSTGGSAADSSSSPRATTLRWPSCDP